MGIADELLKLEQLRERGSLTDDEFARAKAALLAGPAPLADLVRLDHEWEAERQKYEIDGGQYGRHRIPTVEMGLLSVFGGFFFGFAWIILAGSIDGVPLGGRVVVGLFGLAMAAGLAGWGVHLMRLALRYEAARRDYQRRRAALGGRP